MKTNQLSTVLLAVLALAFLSGAQGQVWGHQYSTNYYPYYSTYSPYYYSYYYPSFYPTYLPYYSYPYYNQYSYWDWDDWMGHGFYGDEFGGHGGFEGHGEHH